MKKILTVLLLMFTLIPFNTYAKELDGAENMKDKYIDLYSIDSNCKPLVTPNGIAVDSSGNIYIVNMMFSKVQVYKNNQFLYSYSISEGGTGGGSMHIKIDKDDNLYVSLSRSDIGLKFYNKQLIGAVDNYQNYTEYPNEDNNSCTDIYGNIYKLHSILGYDYIIKTTPEGVKSTAYSIPISHFLLKFFLCLLFIALFIAIMFIVLKMKKEIKKEG